MNTATPALPRPTPHRAHISFAMRQRFHLVMLLAVAGGCLLGFPARGQTEDEYLPGGSLAGLKLPLYKAQHGAGPGHPGCLPELIAQGEETTDVGVTYKEWGPHGLAPEVELYPGAVEHYRAYWFKYCPVRSSYDRQTQLKNFVAPAIPGASKAQVEDYAEPIWWVPRHKPPKFTEHYNKPVAVVRCKVKDPVFKLDLGTLSPGVYVVRLVGVVEKENLRGFLLPAFVGMRVNDGIDGERHQYRIRIGYQDEFYGIADMYFYAPAKRRYEAELWLDEGSQVDVLVHNISLDAVLAGTARRAVKKRGLTMHLPADIAKVKKSVWRYERAKKKEAARRERLERQGKPEPPAKEIAKDERWARDAALWQGLPHPNHQGARNKLGRRGKAPYVLGVGAKSLEEIEAEHGKWETVYPQKLSVPVTDDELKRLGSLLENKKLGLSYSMADLAALRPLPDPYPYKDTGAGIYSPDPEKPGAGRVFWPIADAINGNPYYGFGAGYLGLARQGSSIWMAYRDETIGRDAAVALLRFAYQYPTFDMCRYLEPITTYAWAYGRVQFRRKMTMNSVYGNFIRFHWPLESYDRLHDYIQGNEDLARSVARFVPWVKNSEDLIELLDVYLVQTMAKRVMRFQYYGDGRQPWRIAEIASCLGDNEFTRPWMQWLFRRTFFYPQPIGGLADYAIAGTDRDGRSPIGSYSYMIGEFSADLAAQQLEKYIALGGDPEWDMRNDRQYPKTQASIEYYFSSRTAGLGFPRIGDVAGPDKRTWQYFNSLTARAPAFWRWHQDPRWAWVAKHFTGRQAETDEEWAAIETAAAKIARAPWLENRSRVLPGWGAFLESGVAHNDYRFRSSAMLRLDYGHGHAHFDGLDLQLYAHGLPMTIDAGQRGGYSSPGDRGTRLHNTVEVDGKSWIGHSWAQAMTDAPGASYVRCQASHTLAKGLFRRQIAMIDVDPGRGAATDLTPKQMGPDPKGLPKDVVTPNAYVFDVFRVAGGEQHTYCFHATVNDPNGPQPKVNAVDWQTLDAESTEPGVQQARAYLAGFTNEKLSGKMPAKLEALFQLQKTRLTKGKISSGTEDYFTPRDIFDAEAPDKFTKLHLFAGRDAVVMKGDQHCHKWEYWIPHLFVQRRGEALETAFAAVIEPYAGKPFIAAIDKLDVADNEDDALGAVALAVRTVNGRRDLCFSDGRPEKTRKFGDFTAAGEFAFHSTDEQGLRQAQLTGGTVLTSPQVRIQLARREYTGKVVSVDYPAKTLQIDQPWPPSRQPRVLEIGDVAGGGRRGYLTGYTAAGVEPTPQGATLTMQRSADYYRSFIKRVDETAGVVECTLNVPGTMTNLAGLAQNFIASDEARSKFWRADVVGTGNSFKLTGGKVQAADFAPANAFRLWEYGVGDAVRQSTFASLRRLAPGRFEVEANVQTALALKARAIEVSADGKTWRALAGKADGEWFRVELKPEDFTSGPLRLRLME